MHACMQIMQTMPSGIAAGDVLALGAIPVPLTLSCRPHGETRYLTLLTCAALLPP